MVCGGMGCQNLYARALLLPYFFRAGGIPPHERLEIPEKQETFCMDEIHTPEKKKDAPQKGASRLSFP